MSLALDALGEQVAEPLAKRAVQLAMQGDSAVLLGLLARLWPIRRSAPVRFPLPPLDGPGGAAAAAAAVAAAMADGTLSPAEAADVASVLAKLSELGEVAALREQVGALEAEVARMGEGRG